MRAVPFDWCGRASLDDTVGSDETKMHYMHAKELLLTRSTPFALAPDHARSVKLTWERGAAAASTLHAEFFPDFSLSKGYFTADVEVFVISGALRVGDLPLKRHGYTFIPAGVCVGAWTVESVALGETGVRVLWMTSDEAKHVPSSSNHPDVQKLSEYVPPVDTMIKPWGGTDTAQFVVSRKKWLRRDKQGGGTWLLGVLPHYDGGAAMVQM